MSSNSITDITSVDAETAATLPSIGGTAVVKSPSSTDPVVMAPTLPSIGGAAVVQSPSVATPDKFDDEEDETPISRHMSSMPVKK